MDVDFELSQQLQGHESQVRCAAILGDGSLVTGGLDSQVIVWRRPSETEGFALVKKLGHHSDFVYALAPSHSSPGAFYSGSKDKTAMRVDKEGNPTLQFVGHEGPVCSVVEMGAQVVTGAWDGKAKVWDATTGECRLTLDAGAHAVTVAALPTGEIVTGSQDGSLRVFRGSECKHKVDQAHADIIRAIAVSSTHLITASNDNLLKMWSFDGCEMASLAGHSSFVYGATHSADSKAIFSSSDDCTLKVWSAGDMSCKQSVVHSGTVWQTCALPNGDAVTCCADMVVRVWTQNPERFAPEAERQAQKEMAENAALQAAAKGSSSAPMEGTEDISKMATTIGKKNGEIKCFKDGETVFAFSWNAGARQWDKIGEVVGQENEKKFYEGDHVFPRGEYDYVWDVDMGPSMGMRKLPYNKGQNPMEVAESFCSREQIHKGNTDQIRQFIQQNSGQGGAAAPAPSAGGGGYGGASGSSEAVSSVFPIMTVVSFKDGKFDPLQAKILEFNGQVDEALRLDSTEILHLTEGIAKLKSGVMSKEIRECERQVIHSKLGEWPADKLFPVVDLWRLYLVHPQSADNFKGSDRGAPFLAKVINLLTADVNTSLALCCARFLANMFIYQTNKYALFDKREFVLRSIEPALKSRSKHTKVAIATVLLNIAIVMHESSQPPKQWDADSARTVTRMALDFLANAGPDDGDAQQRAALAIGTMLPRDRANGGAVARACVEAGLPMKLAIDLKSKVGANYAEELTRLLS
eukprot:TRINITY_DN62784_c0_g1_i1.p1 TRINITY_DN62784_c0_g1~~TRINITY_DN62784_c0_g1_i1.p1  ORF type:complete len:750 (-),score=174.68 TRINITY_DN62784_c0_g1_i1:117-2366(-)